MADRNLRKCIDCICFRWRNPLGEWGVYCAQADKEIDAVSIEMGSKPKWCPYMQKPASICEYCYSYTRDCGHKQNLNGCCDFSLKWEVLTENQKTAVKSLLALGCEMYEQGSTDANKEVQNECNN